MYGNGLLHVAESLSSAGMDALLCKVRSLHFVDEDAEGPCLKGRGTNPLHAGCRRQRSRLTAADKKPDNFQVCLCLIDIWFLESHLQLYNFSRDEILGRAAHNSLSMSGGECRCLPALHPPPSGSMTRTSAKGSKYPQAP